MNIDELQIRAEKILDDYEKIINLPEFNMVEMDDINTYFNMKIEQLNKLTSIECAEGAYILARYCFYLQRMYNRESAKNKWAIDQMNKLICDKLSEYDTYMKYEHKISLIAKENSVVEKLQKIINYTNQVMERLNFLASAVKNMSEMISNLQKAKSYSERATNYGHQ